MVFALRIIDVLIRDTYAGMLLRESSESEQCIDGGLWQRARQRIAHRDDDVAQPAASVRGAVVQKGREARRCVRIRLVGGQLEAQRVVFHLEACRLGVELAAGVFELVELGAIACFGEERFVGGGLVVEDGGRCCECVFDDLVA